MTSNATRGRLGGCVRAVASCAALALLLLPCKLIAGAPRALTWGLKQHTTYHYTFRTERQISTELLEVPADLAQAEGLPALRDALRSWKLVLEGALDQQLARIFRDGTWGQLVRITEAQGWQERPDGSVPIEAEGLVGKSVVLRGWPSGEVFETAGFHELAGAGRLVEHWFDVFPMLTLRLPRQLPTGAPSPGAPTEEPAKFTLRVQLQDRAAVEQDWSVVWQRAEEVPCEGAKCHALAWTATLTETDKNERVDRATQVTGSGTAQGVVHLEASTRRLVRHEYRIHRVRELSSREVARERGTEGAPRARARIVDDSTTLLQRKP